MRRTRGTGRRGETASLLGVMGQHGCVLHDGQRRTRPAVAMTGTLRFGLRARCSGVLRSPASAQHLATTPAANGAGRAGSSGSPPRLAGVPAHLRPVDDVQRHVGARLRPPLAGFPERPQRRHAADQHMALAGDPPRRIIVLGARHGAADDGADALHAARPSTPACDDPLCGTPDNSGRRRVQRCVRPTEARARTEPDMEGARMPAPYPLPYPHGRPLSHCTTCRISLLATEDTEDRGFGLLWGTAAVLLPEGKLTARASVSAYPPAARRRPGATRRCRDGPDPARSPGSSNSRALARRAGGADGGLHPRGGRLRGRLAVVAPCDSPAPLSRRGPAWPRPFTCRWGRSCGPPARRRAVQQGAHSAAREGPRPRQERKGPGRTGGQGHGARGLTQDEGGAATSRARSRHPAVTRASSPCLGRLLSPAP